LRKERTRKGREGKEEGKEWGEGNRRRGVGRGKGREEGKVVTCYRLFVSQHS
jgi:hypothetical protein